MRRDFLKIAAAAGALGIAVKAVPLRAASPLPVKAVAFDGLALFDPRPVQALVEQAFPGRGSELSALWRNRQFEYTWLRTVMGRYADFRQVTEEALVFAARSLSLELPAATRARLMAAFFELRAWSDVAPVLAALKAAGLRMALHSNFTAAMLDAAVRNSRLEGYFEPHLTTDLVRAFKPDPRAYALAPSAFGLDRREIAFVAFGGWDAAGASAFGFPCYWVNRLKAAPEELGSFPAFTASGLQDLPRFVGAPSP